MFIVFFSDPMARVDAVAAFLIFTKMGLFEVCVVPILLTQQTVLISTCSLRNRGRNKQRLIVHQRILFVARIPVHIHVLMFGNSKIGEGPCGYTAHTTIKFVRLLDPFVRTNREHYFKKIWSSTWPDKENGTGLNND